MIACSTGPHPRCQSQQVQTNFSLHNLGAVLCLHSSNPLFYLANIGPHFLFPSSPYSRSHTLPAGHTGAAWQREMTNDSCQVKCGCSPYMIRALALVSELCSYIVRLQLLCVKIVFCFILCLQILLFFVRLSSGSALLSYHLRPDLLSTLFLSTLSPISCANKRPTAVSLFALQYKYHTSLFCILLL